MDDALKADFEQANARHREGNLDDAERGYRYILDRDPRFMAALCNLGVIAGQRRQFDESERLLAEALSIQPDAHHVRLLRAKVLGEMGRLADAIVCYDHVLGADPRNFAALNDRAAVFIRCGRYADAIVDLDAALAVAPADPLAFYNKANVLLALNRPTDALTAVESAVAAKPDFVDSHVVRGNILGGLGRRTEAIASYDQALALNPQRLDVLNNRAGALLDEKRLVEALEGFDRVLALDSRHIEALVNRGRTLGKLGRRQEELASYDQALAVRPDFAAAHLCRGVALADRREFDVALASIESALALESKVANAWHAHATVLVALERIEEASRSFERALEIDPNYTSALSNRAMLLRRLGRFEEAVETFARLCIIDPDYPYALGSLFSARLYCCDWTDYDAANTTLTAGIRSGKPLETPFSFMTHSQSSGDQLLCARHYTARLGASSAWRSPPYDNAKIHLAYFSADLQNHATAHLIAGLFEAHDRSRFEVTGISFGPNDGSRMRARLEAAFDRFIDVRRRTNEDVVALARDLRIDIAIDLKGFTNDARPEIFASRAAPIQVNFLGYPSTWGSHCMDYIIADAQLIPPVHEIFYTEKVVLLPDTYQPNDRKRAIATTGQNRATWGLPEHGFVFCSFNGSYKITPAVFDVWMRLLREVEGSVLWLLQTNDAVVRNLRREAAARGVAPDRLIFSPMIEAWQHLERQRLADLFLDTLPVNAHTTASDALWAGLPLLTCVGTTFAGRVAASLLRAAGLPELVTQSLPEYEVIALKLAANQPLLAEIRAKLGRNRDTCALFDTDRFCRNLETAFATMQERHRRGEPPARFTVG